MKTHLSIPVAVLMLALPGWLTAQDNLKIKDQLGNIVLEASGEGVAINLQTHQHDHQSTINNHL